MQFGSLTRFIFSPTSNNLNEILLIYLNQFCPISFQFYLNDFITIYFINLALHILKLRHLNLK